MGPAIPDFDSGDGVPAYGGSLPFDDPWLYPSVSSDTRSTIDACGYSTASVSGLYSSPDMPDASQYAYATTSHIDPTTYAWDYAQGSGAATTMGAYHFSDFGDAVDRRIHRSVSA